MTMMTMFMMLDGDGDGQNRRRRIVVSSVKSYVRAIRSHMHVQNLYLALSSTGALCQNPCEKRVAEHRGLDE